MMLGCHVKAQQGQPLGWAMWRTWRWRLPCCTLLWAVLGLHAAAAAEAAIASDEDPYARAETWLCRPGRADLCAAPQALSVVAADGRIEVSTWQPQADAPIDCFYVYPTVSDDPHGNSSWVPGPGEARAVTDQFAAFASVCRPYAPMYRQITVAGLESYVRGAPLAIDPELGYLDVRAAWQHYLKYDNQGRQVILIGHSQGANVLAHLLRREIEGRADQGHVLGAILLGMNVEVPKGQDVGGTFKVMPLCRRAEQSGCILTYDTFRANRPPPERAHFGRSAAPETMEVGCTDPTLLSGEPLRMALPAQAKLSGQPAVLARWEPFVASLKTPFVALPGLIDVACVSDQHGTYLSARLVAQDPGAARPADIPGDLVVDGQLLDTWGLHLIDVNLALGNLIDWVGFRGQHVAP